MGECTPDTRYPLRQDQIAGKPDGKIAAPKLHSINGNRIGKFIAGETIIKGIIIHHAHAVGDIDRLDIRQFPKGLRTDKGDTFGEGHGLQACGDIGTVCLIAARAEDITEPGNFGIFEGGANKGKGNFRKIAAVDKRADANKELFAVCAGDDDLCKPCAAEGVFAEVDEGFGQGQFLYARIGERIAVYAEQPIGFGNGQFGKRSTAVEGEIGNFPHAVGEKDIFQPGTTVESALVHAGEHTAFGEDNRFETFAHRKGVVVDRNDAGGDGDFRQGVRAVEGAIADGEDIAVLVEGNLFEAAVFKGAEADGFQRFGQRKAARSAGGHGDDLAHVFIVQNPVRNRILGVIFVRRKLFQRLQAHKGVFADVGEVGGNMQRSQTRIIEHVAHKAQIRAPAEVDGLQICTVAEGVMVYERHAVRERDGNERGTRKRGFRNFRQRAVCGEGHIRNSAVIKRVAAHRLQRGGDFYRIQFPRIGERPLFHYFQGAVLRKDHAFERGMEEGVSGDIFHICGYGNGSKPAAREYVCLDACQRIGQDDVRHRRIIEGISADRNDVPAKIKRSQVDLRLRSAILDNGDIAAVEDGIRPIAARDDVAHADVIPADARVPILLQMQGQFVAREIDVEPLRPVKGVSADVFDRFRKVEAGERRTAVKGVSADIFHRGRKEDVDEIFVIPEGVIVYIRNLRVAEIHAREAAHALQTVRLNARERAALFKGDRAQVFTAFEHIRRNALEAAVCRKSHAREIGIAQKRILRDRGNARGDAERSQTRIGERPVTYARQRAVFRKRHAAQRIIVGERIPAYLIHRVGNGEVCQRSVLRKGVFLYVRQRLRQRIGADARAGVKAVCAHRFQSGRKLYRSELVRPVERGVPDFCHTVCHDIRRRIFPLGIGDDFRRVDIVHDAVDVLIRFVAAFHGNFRKTSAGGERPGIELYQARGQSDRAEPALQKGKAADPLKGLGQIDLLEAVSIRESPVAYHLQSAVLPERDGREIVIVDERLVADHHEGIGQRDLRQRRISKSIASDLREIAPLRKRDFGEGNAHRKRVARNIYDIGGNVYGRKRGTAEKRIIRDGRQPAAQHDLAQIEIHLKRACAHVRHHIRYDHALQRGISKGSAADRLHAAQPRFGQPRVGKGIVPDCPEGRGRGICLPLPRRIGDQRTLRIIV